MERSMRLEPCPWCNTPAECLQMAEVQPHVWAVVCPQCGSVGPHPSDRTQPYEDAIRAWNLPETDR
jgi:hypothetical protein